MASDEYSVSECQEIIKKNAPFVEFDNEQTILAEVTHRCISDCSKNIPGS